ncbi:uncharacterized protein LOC110848203 isoform X5 [Folsomia candida]|uniref:uncharacterized protein LOC110848203 isoform X5 n=1 Tax=Folsomia candida TaxID=158441 RepID=UPI0016054A55|nr:uncharacterized protein LOC110848203 isoform X5 [Folsomia candida]
MEDEAWNMLKKIKKEKRASHGDRLSETQKQELLQKLKKEKEEEEKSKQVIIPPKPTSDMVDASMDPRSRSRTSRYAKSLSQLEPQKAYGKSQVPLSPSLLVAPLMNKPAPHFDLKSFKIPKSEASSKSAPPRSTKTDDDEWGNQPKDDGWGEPSRSFSRRSYEHPATANVSAFDCMQPKSDISSQRDYSGNSSRGSGAGFGRGRGPPVGGYQVKQVNPNSDASFEVWGTEETNNKSADSALPPPTAKNEVVETDDWGEPIVKKNPSAIRPTTSAANGAASTRPPPSARKEEVETDKWGEPIVKKNLASIRPTSSAANGAASALPPPPSAKKEDVETDEWGEPIVKKILPTASVATNSAPADDATDEWGEPIKPKAKKPDPVPSTDEWGAPSSKPAGTANPAIDEWGEPVKKANDDIWGAPASTTTSANDSWGGGGSGSSRSSNDGDRFGGGGGRGRGRGRGDRGGGRGRGGGGGGDRPPRQPQEGDWDCPGCSAKNFSGRRECFKCRAAAPPGLGGESRRPPREPQEGDWECPGCNANNFSGRRECFKCHAAAPPGIGGNSNGRGRGGGGGRRREESPNNPNYEPVTKRPRISSGSPAGFDEWGSSSTIPSPSTAGSDDWGTPIASNSKAAPVKKLDEWGAPPVTPVSNANIDDLMRGQPGGRDNNRRRDFNPSSDWGASDAPKPGNDRKCLKEWTCGDTRCGSSNFDWRDDCFRCGALKTSSAVMKPSSRDYNGSRPRNVEAARESRLLKIYSPPSPTCERIKAPPDEKNLGRMLSIASSSSYEKEMKEVFTETPKEWSYGGQGIEMDHVALIHIFNINNGNALPLSHRFEAVAQNPGGGVGVANTLLGARKEVLHAIKIDAEEKQVIRSIKQIEGVTVEAPKTRNKVNLTWKGLRIVVKTGENEIKPSAEKEEHKDEKMELEVCEKVDEKEPIDEQSKEKDGPVVYENVQEKEGLKVDQKEEAIDEQSKEGPMTDENVQEKEGLKVDQKEEAIDEQSKEGPMTDENVQEKEGLKVDQKEEAIDEQSKEGPMTDENVQEKEGLKVDQKEEAIDEQSKEGPMTDENVQEKEGLKVDQKEEAIDEQSKEGPMTDENVQEKEALKVDEKEEAIDEQSKEGPMTDENVQEKEALKVDEKEEPIDEQSKGPMTDEIEKTQEKQGLIDDEKTQEKVGLKVDEKEPIDEQSKETEVPMTDEKVQEKEGPMDDEKTQEKEGLNVNEKEELIDEESKEKVVPMTDEKTREKVEPDVEEKADISRHTFFNLCLFHLLQ